MRRYGSRIKPIMSIFTNRLPQTVEGRNNKLESCNKIQANQLLSIQPKGKL